MFDSDADKHLLEQHVSSQDLVLGSFVHAVRDEVCLPDGSSATREYFVHPGAVMVIPLLESEGLPLQVVLERQYRYPVQQVMIEFPAGKLDAGELHQVCAQRELLEETGYRAGAWAHAGVMYPAIAYSTECIDIWFARDLVPGQRQLDAGEFLDVFTSSVPDFLHHCHNGRITDAKTLVGAWWLHNYVSGVCNLTWTAPL